MQSVLSRAVVILFASLFASKGFPQGHRLYIAYHIVQLRLYYVVSCQSFARYIMKLHFHVKHISRRDCHFRTIVYLSLPENHNQNNCDPFIASIRYHFWLTELPPKFDNLDYIKVKVIRLHVRPHHLTSPTLIAWHYYATL